MNKKLSRLATPYFVWLCLLALFPALIMLFLIFVNSEGISFDGLTFTLANFKQLAEPSTLLAFRNSFFLAFLSTALCIIIGYIVAYKLVRSRIKNKFLILTILILPMWSNILLRTEALGNIMSPHNILADLLGVDHFPDIKGTYLSVLIGLVFTYLPFMILPIYTALEKIDKSLEEAALDLGMTDFQKFWRVIFPLSLKGVLTGSIMTFLPCLSGFAIPEILGQGNIVMIGNVIDQLFRNMDYNTGSLLAIVILGVILLALFLVNKFDKEGETLL